MFGSFRQQIILHFLKRLLFLSVFPLYFVKIFQGSSRWYCSSQISYFLFGWWRQVTEFYFKIGDCGLLFYLIFQFQKGEINHNTSTVHTRKIYFVENTKIWLWDNKLSRSIEFYIALLHLCFLASMYVH